MTNQNNTQEKKEQLINVPDQSQISNQLSSAEIEKLSILRLKSDINFKKSLKKMSEKEKNELKNKYNHIYHQPFGNLEITKEELEELKSLERKNSTIYRKKIEKLNYDLAQAPPEDNFENFPHENDPIAVENDSIPTNERVRIALSILPEELKALFKEFFKVSLTNTNWDQSQGNRAQRNNEILAQASGGAIIEPYLEKGKQKYRIVVDLDSCYETETEYYGGLPLTTTYFDLKKLNYLIVRSMLATIKDKEEFADFLKKKDYKEKIDKNCPDNIDDWLAICLSDPDSAKEFGKESELYNKAIDWLKKSFKKDGLKPQNPQNLIIQSRDIDKKILKQKTMKYTDSQTGKPIADTWQKILGFTDKHNMSWLGKALISIGKFMPTLDINYDDYYFLIADLDQKEAKKIMSLEKTGGDYIKMLQIPRYYEDKDNMRYLLLVIAQKGAYQSWMAHLWLNKHDELYKKTKGKEISRDAFDFITRLTKDAGKGLKSALRAEYRQDEQGKYVRQSFEIQVKALDAIFNQMSLREIQRISADAYGQNWDDTKKEFIDIDKKIEIEEDGKVYVNSLDGDLCKLIGKDEAHAFVKNMKVYANEVGEEQMLNLANPLVTALTRRYLQASREEPMLFSMYTAPMIRQGFEKYKNKVGEPEYSTREYNDDFKKYKKELEENDHDIEQVVDKTSYEDLRVIFQEYTKEKSEKPYVRGLQTTKYGKITEFVSQAKEKVLELELPDGIHNYIRSKMDQTSKEEVISTEYIDKLHRDIKDKTENLDHKKRMELYVELDNFFKRLAGIGIIKQYQAVFRPYTKHLNSYLTSKDNSLDKKEKKELNDWYYRELLPAENQTIEEKIANIERQYPEISISENQKKLILEKPEEERIGYLSDIINKKISSKELSGRDKFMSDYNSLNNLWAEANQAIKYPDQYKGNLTTFIDQFKTLNLVPEKDKSEPIIHYKQLLNRLKIAKIVADDYYVQEEAKKQARANRGLMGYISEEEEELEYEEMNESA